MAENDEKKVDARLPDEGKVWLAQTLITMQDGTVGTHFVGSFTDKGAAERCLNDLKASMAVMMKGAIVVETPAGVQPCGLTVEGLLSSLGVKGILHRAFSTEPKGAVLHAAPRIILPNA